MGKQFDELSKALARGTSRRAALKRFALGAAGAAVASLLPGRNAEAQYAFERVYCQALCIQWREDYGLADPGRESGQCVANCASCLRRGGEFIILNNLPFCTR